MQAYEIMNHQNKSTKNYKIQGSKKIKQNEIKTGYLINMNKNKLCKYYDVITM